MFIKILFVNKSFILIIYYKLNNISNFQILLNTIRLQYFKLLLYSNQCIFSIFQIEIEYLFIIIAIDI